MDIPIYQIDAFAETLFTGNPAAVCPLRNWLPDDAMQKIAAENNLAETAFYAPEGAAYRIRWFTPAVEVDLCGHATLAAAHVAFAFEGHQGTVIEFASRSGTLRVRKDGGRLVLDFPADPPTQVPSPGGLAEALGRAPAEVWKGRSDYLLVYPAQADVAGMAPDFRRLGAVEARGIIVTAPGEGVDFVSRFFGPRVGIDEDPVTGSAHTTLTPYWARRLGKGDLSAMQLSRRRGWLRCRLAGDRVEIAGKAVPYLRGTITVG
jgi:PhzF family phenazine biosynthesis protein